MPRKRRAVVTTDADGFVQVTYTSEPPPNEAPAREMGEEMAAEAAELAALAGLRGAPLDDEQPAPRSTKPLPSTAAGAAAAMGTSGGGGGAADEVWSRLGDDKGRRQLRVLDAFAELADITSLSDTWQFPGNAELGVSMSVAATRRVVPDLKAANLAVNPAWASLARWIHPFNGPRSRDRFSSA